MSILWYPYKFTFNCQNVDRFFSFINFFVANELSDDALQHYLSGVELLKDENDVSVNQKSLLAEIAGELAGMESENYEKIRDLINGAKKIAVDTFVDHISYVSLKFKNN